MKFKAVFFDCDGVLTDFGWRTFCKEIGVTEELQGKWAEQFLSHKITYNQWRTQYENRCLESKLTLKKLGELFDDIKINPEAEELLPFLKKSGVFTAVISSGVEYYNQTVAKKLGLSTWVGNIKLEFDSQGNFKRFKEKYRDEIEAKVKEVLEICGKNEFQPTETVFVGDSYNDISTFKLTRHGVLYKRPWSKKFEKDAWKTIENLNEIKDLVV